MDVTNYYWSRGFADGEFNYRPNVECRRYNLEQLDKYFAGYRCGVRTQLKNGYFDREDQQLRI
jgi:hypothetical protein